MFSPHNSDNDLPPVPTFRTPVYSGRLQIGVLDHYTKVITLHHSPLPLHALGLTPGSLVVNHQGVRYGRLGEGGQLIRFAS